MCAMRIDDVFNEKQNNKRFQTGMNEKVEVRLSGVSLNDQVNGRLRDRNGVYSWSPAMVGPERVKQKSVGGSRVLYAVFDSKPARGTSPTPQSLPTGDLTIEITNESTSPPTTTQPTSFVVTYA